VCFLKLDIPLHLHRGPPHILIVHRKINIGRPRRIPELDIHAPIGIERSPHRTVLPQLPIPRQRQRPVAPDRGGYHILFVQLLRDGHLLIVPGGGHPNEGIVGVVGHHHVPAAATDVVPRIDRDAIAVVLPSLGEFEECHAGSSDVPGFGGRRSDDAQFEIAVVVVPVDLEVDAVHGLYVQFEAGGEGEGVLVVVGDGEGAGGSAPDAAGEGG